MTHWSLNPHGSNKTMWCKMRAPVQIQMIMSICAFFVQERPTLRITTVCPLNTSQTVTSKHVHSHVGVQVPYKERQGSAFSSKSWTFELPTAILCVQSTQCGFTFTCVVACFHTCVDEMHTHCGMKREREKERQQHHGTPPLHTCCVCLCLCFSLFHVCVHVNVNVDVKTRGPGRSMYFDKGAKD